MVELIFAMIATLMGWINEAPVVRAPEVPMLLGWEDRNGSQVIEVNFISYSGASVLWTEEWFVLGGPPGDINYQVYSTYAPRPRRRYENWRFLPAWHYGLLDDLIRTLPSDESTERAYGFDLIYE